jgi:hypothetical protein
MNSGPHGIALKNAAVVRPPRGAMVFFTSAPGPFFRAAKDAIVSCHGAG